MDVLKMILSIVLIIDCIACVIVVLMQEGKSAGLGSISGASTDTYWGKNKARSQEGRMKMFTVIAAVVFFVISIVLNLSVLN